jgi:hypothetical protein
MKPPRLTIILTHCRRRESKRNAVAGRRRSAVFGRRKSVVFERKKIGRSGRRRRLPD